MTQTTPVKPPPSVPPPLPETTMIQNMKSWGYGIGAAGGTFAASVGFASLTSLNDTVDYIFSKTVCLFFSNFDTCQPGYFSDRNVAGGIRVPAGLTYLAAGIFLSYCLFRHFRDMSKSAYNATNFNHNRDKAVKEKKAYDDHQSKLFAEFKQKQEAAEAAKKNKNGNEASLFWRIGSSACNYALEKVRSIPTTTPTSTSTLAQSPSLTIASSPSVRHASTSSASGAADQFPIH